VRRFYARDELGLPRDWIATMKHSIESVVGPFSAHRMVRDYALRFYGSAAESR
jgi:starch phosphorylase